MFPKRTAKWPTSLHLPCTIISTINHCDHLQIGPLASAFICFQPSQGDPCKIQIMLFPCLRPSNSHLIWPPRLEATACLCTQTSSCPLTRAPHPLACLLFPEHAELIPDLRLSQPPFPLPGKFSAPSFSRLASYPSVTSYTSLARPLLTSLPKFIGSCAHIFILLPCFTVRDDVRLRVHLRPSASPARGIS